MASKVDSKAQKDSPKEPEVKLYKCSPIDFMYIPKTIRKVLGYITMVIFACSFFSPIFIMILLSKSLWVNHPYIMIGIALSYAVSMVMPQTEWPLMRQVGQLWYDLLDFSINQSPQEVIDRVEYAKKHQLILAMHPHGIVPFHAVLWASICDQSMRDDQGNSMYGFGAAADVVMYIPFLRNFMGWLTAGSASYKPLIDGLTKGLVPCANRNGSTPKHLFILPGGVAEIFCSKPGKHAMVFKNRKGIVKLSVETGAQLVPCYVFGGTDFYETLATSDSFIARISRSLKAGITIFWGYFYLPLPFIPKVTMVMGTPIPIPKVADDDEKHTKTIELLHKTFTEEMISLFDKYKAVAGYPDAQLEII